MNHNSVVIKAHNGGIVIVLDATEDFEQLKEKIAEKFRESAHFFKKARMAISFEGRKLSNEEQIEILNVISNNSELKVICILEDNPEADARFQKTLNDKLMEMSNNTGQFYKGTLRSGQVLEFETSIVIIGDVNPGARIVSKGNIIILGALKGTAFAGATGNENAFVVALDMSPVQIRIADIIARAPDKPAKERIKEAKIAFVEEGNIYIEKVNKSVLNDISL